VASILLALTSAPETPAGRRALGLAESLSGLGHALTLCCLQDSVVLASTRAPDGARAALGRLLDRGAGCLVLGEDLTLRGLEPAARASAVDYGAMVAALAAGHDRVLGAF